MDIGTISPEGYHEWDGEKWIPVGVTKLSDDGVWMWNGEKWIPNPNHLPNSDHQLPHEPVHQQMPIPQTMPNQIVTIQATNKQKSGLWVSLVLGIPIVIVAITVVLAGVLYVWASDLAEEQNQEELAGTWYNPGDTLTLYSNGSVDESTGTITHWSTEGYNLTTTFLIDGEEVDLIWRYEIKIDNDDDRVLFMAFYDVENETQTDEISGDSCVVYFDSVRGTEESYVEDKIAIIPEWCNFEE